MPVSNFEKKYGFLPQRMARRGRKPHFFPKKVARIVQQTGNLPEIQNTPSGGRLKSPHGGGVPFSSIPCCPIWGPGTSPFWPRRPKMSKMVQKQSTPVFDHFFGKFPVCWTMLATFFGKKCGFLPQRAIRRGIKPHFFSKLHTSIVQQTRNFPKSCF